MKIFVLNLFFVFIGLSLWSCSDDNGKITDNEGKSVYALFLKNNIEVSNTGGTAIAIVEWSQT